MFDAEVIGMQALQEEYIDLVRVPQSLATGYLSEFDHDQGAWFVSEFVFMRNTTKKKLQQENYQFAHILAKMHKSSAENHSRSSRSGQFGFDSNNFYVHTEQDNTWQNDWCTFFVEQRFKPIVKRMKTDPHLIDDHDKTMELILLCERLIPYIPWFLASDRVNIPPCLLHGDLNAQNWSMDSNGQIVIFDGSPFYGPYEMDIFTMPETFLQSYFHAIGGPVEGYEMRFELYNLLRLLSSIIDSELYRWRTYAFQSLNKLLIHCGAWTSSLARFPCGVKTPIDKIKLPSPTNSAIKKKNAILIYGGAFCPIHLNHLEVMNLVAETLEKPPHNFEILAGYFCPSTENWVKRKLPNSYLPNAYRESLLMLATEGTRWMVDRSYSTADKHSQNIMQAICDIYDKNSEITLIHICGIDAIKQNEKRVSTQYPLVVVDRLGYNGENFWKEYLQSTTVKNKKRLIWISPWKGEMRSSTMIRDLLTKSEGDNDTDVRQSLLKFLPASCIDYILEYKLKKWFKPLEVF
jgi:fructosamine-3-kinase/nicotinic acid mononucleotide adenylyltransferase